MALACLWLVWVLGQQTGTQGLALLALAATGLVLLLWVIGRRQRGEQQGLALLGLGLAVMIGATILIALAPQSFKPVRDETNGLGSEPYAPARLAALRAEGRTVFVNLTAAWCITCRVNELLALSSDKVAAAFRARDVAYLKGDWTLRDPDISRLLAAYGRNGVPLYLVFPAGAPRALTLPQLLSEDIVIRAVQDAALPAR
jgi:thiol:disulfide interchange protein DsbD